MATQVIDQQMVECFMQLNQAEKKSVVQLIKTFLKNRTDAPGRISIEQYNRELDEAEAEIERGEFYTQEQVKEISKSWIDGK
jgi:predicted transcriptional regulator